MVRLAVELLDAGPWGRFTAYELVANHRGVMTSLEARAVEALARGDAARTLDLRTGLKNPRHSRG